MKEEDIRPEAVFREYVRLSGEDAARLLARSGEFQRIECPACPGARSTHAFAKDGFTFEECMACGSLFANPRPSPALLAQFYASSRSSIYWAEVFWPAVAGARLEQIIVPRVQAVLGHRLWDRVVAASQEPITVVDVGAGAGAFLLEMASALSQPHRVVAVEPGESLANQARGAGIEVIEASAEDPGVPTGIGDLVTSFEVIEHVFDPFAFVCALRRVTASKGMALCTGLGGDGLDIRVLREHAGAVSVPHHLNFLSVEGFRRVFERAGFAEVEIETPGNLDVELVKKASEAGEAIPDFLRVLLNERDEEIHGRFQQFLRDARLSSHTWIWASG